jgi:hypothetical protein
MSLFRKKPIQLQVVRRDEHKLRLADWQQDQQLCAMAAKLLNNSDFVLMLSVLKNEHPAHTALPYGVAMDDRVVLQARSEGYEICLANLEALGKSTLPVEMPEAAFEAV